MRPHLIILTIGLRWFFDMASELWWSSGHEFESHYLHLFDKNQTQDNMGMCKFQVQRVFHLKGCVRE